MVPLGLSNNASDPHNYKDLATMAQNTANAFDPSDQLYFENYTGLNWDHDAEFQSTVTVGGLQVTSSYATSSDAHNIVIDQADGVFTTGGSTIYNPYVSIIEADGALLELNSGTWTAGTVSGGILRCDKGTVTINPAAGSSVTADTELEIIGATVKYTGQGDLALQNGGSILITNGGYFLGQINPVPPDGADQSITTTAALPIIQVTDGTFEVGGYTHHVQAGIDVNGGVLLVDAGTVLDAQAGVLAEASGTIELQGGQSGAPTTIDTGSKGLALNDTSTLETVNDSASFHYSEIVGDLTAALRTTVWVGYQLSGIGFSSGYGPNLFVSGNVTLNGTLELGVYTFGNPRPPVGYVAAYLSCNQSVTFGNNGQVAIKAYGPGQPQSGDDLLVVDCTPGSGTTNEPFAAPPGYTMGLESNNQQLWLTKD